MRYCRSEWESCFCFETTFAPTSDEDEIVNCEAPHRRTLCSVSQNLHSFEASCCMLKPDHFFSKGILIVELQNFESCFLVVYVVDLVRLLLPVSIYIARQLKGRAIDLDSGLMWVWAFA